eukprot:g4663.t1
MYLRKTTTIRCQNERSDNSGPLLSVETPSTRRSTLEPSRVPIVHSPAYFLQQSEIEGLLEESREDQELEDSSDEMSFEKNPVNWMLANADEMLDEMERNPNQTTKAIWKVANSPIGQGTAAGVRTAAKVTLKTGGHTSHSFRTVIRDRSSENGNSSWNMGDHGRIKKYV